MEGQNLCYKKLRKVYQSLEEQRTRVEETLTKSATWTNSLSNLLEQLAACDKVSFSKEPLVGFEKLEEKLRFKLVKAMESVMVKLHNDLSILKDASKKISEYKRSAFEVYSQHALQGNVSIEETVQGSPTCPSISELLELLTDLDTKYSELYERKLEILESISYEDPLMSKVVLRGWHSISLSSKYQGFTMDKVRVFLNNSDKT